jgi:hypothetical protein
MGGQVSTREQVQVALKVGKADPASRRPVRPCARVNIIEHDSRFNLIWWKTVRETLFRCAIVARGQNAMTLTKGSHPPNHILKNQKPTANFPEAGVLLGDVAAERLDTETWHRADDTSRRDHRRATAQRRAKQRRVEALAE